MRRSAEDLETPTMRVVMGLVGIVFAAWLTIVWSEVSRIQQQVDQISAGAHELWQHGATQTEALARLDERIRAIEGRMAVNTETLHRIELTVAGDPPRHR